MTTEEVVVVGFDSAWTDHRRKPGAICAAFYGDGTCEHFEPPRLVSFAEGLSFIATVERPGVPLIVALDQPTIVPNTTGSRPVDKIAGSLVSWVGGGVQPANRGKRGMFDDEAPIWRFVEGLGAVENPEKARSATTGRHLIEVFPALALIALEAAFCGRLMGPRYNPERRKTFRFDHWRAVLGVATAEARRLRCEPAARWLPHLDINPVRKADQDRLDALICLLVGLRWRLESREKSVMLGCINYGYMVTPVTSAMHLRLSRAAMSRGVPIDNVLPPTIGPTA